jgi:hypothetical protein
LLNRKLKKNYKEEPRLALESFEEKQKSNLKNNIILFVVRKRKLTKKFLEAGDEEIKLPGYIYNSLF